NETLYRVSTNNNNVLMEKLRQWNHLTSDKIPSASKLIVGFLVNPSTQALAVNNTQKPETTNNSNADANKNIKTEVSKPETNKEITQQNKQEQKPEQKQDLKPEKDEPKKTGEVVQVKEEVKPDATTQGYFSTSFSQQVKQQPLSKEQTVTSGIFKTSSGWSDAKYYLLMNGAEPGTIVRITNPSNNKIVYAKLLGEMSSATQSQGLNIRISDAAAAALDVSDTGKFIVKLNY
ncbi:MAG TPA: hypothetical protein VGG71_05085, partial [Chitinophagaceae bacterium]